MIRVSTAPRKRNSPRIAEKDAPAFLRWLRGRECVFRMVGKCEGKLESMHLDFAGDKGVGTKVSDRYALPSCAGHHRAQHSLGWDTFISRARTTKAELLFAAATYWNRWPCRLAWERKFDV